MKKVTLGGERLGSGNKMKVELHGFERSTHDMSYVFRTTMAAGTLVPYLDELALPGDTFDIHLNCDIKTHPTVGPLFGSYKVQLDVFTVPYRLYNSATHNNRLQIGNAMYQVKLPKLKMLGTVLDLSTQADIDNAQTDPSSLIAYLGIRGVGNTENGIDLDTGRLFNAVPFLGYWDIYKNYYANKQEEVGYYINQNLDSPATITNVEIGDADGVLPIPQLPAAPVARDLNQSNIYIKVSYTGTTPNPRTLLIYTNLWPTGINMTTLCNDNIEDLGGGVLLGQYDFAKWGNDQAFNWDYQRQPNSVQSPPVLEQFPLDNIDQMRDLILTTPWNNQLVIDDTTIGAPYSTQVYQYTLVGGRKVNAAQQTQNGLGIKAYQSDLFNNWLNTEWLDGFGGVNEITKVDTTSGGFNIEALILSKKVYEMLTRIAVSGGSFNDWLETVYDHDRFTLPETPVYQGGLIKELVFQEVVSNSASGTEPLGQLAGKGVMGSKHKGGTVVIRVDEPCQILGIVSLTPRLDYSQGNKWHVNLKTWNDFHKPNLDQIGFQELITEQMAYWTTYLPSGGDINDWVQQSAGKQPAWLNYMTNVNVVRGNFAIKNSEMFMVLNRRYEPTGITPHLSIKDLTTYIDPSKFNQIFAQTSLDAQNFWVQISVDMIARRKMSAKVMPNL